MKRLKKTDDKVTWALKDLCKARGMDDDEIELLLAQRPNRGSLLPQGGDGEVAEYYTKECKPMDPIQA